jgi:hypothetical protein
MKTGNPKPSLTAAPVEPIRAFARNLSMTTPPFQVTLCTAARVGDRASFVQRCLVVNDPVEKQPGVLPSLPNRFAARRQVGAEPGEEK